MNRLIHIMAAALIALPTLAHAGEKGVEVASSYVPGGDGFVEVEDSTAQPIEGARGRDDADVIRSVYNRLDFQFGNLVDAPDSLRYVMIAGELALLVDELGFGGFLPRAYTGFEIGYVPCGRIEGTDYIEPRVCLNGGLGLVRNVETDPFFLKIGAGASMNVDLEQFDPHFVAGFGLTFDEVGVLTQVSGIPDSILWHSHLTYQVTRNFGLRPFVDVRWYKEEGSFLLAESPGIGMVLGPRTTIKTWWSFPGGGGIGLEFELDSTIRNTKGAAK